MGHGDGYQGPGEADGRHTARIVVPTAPYDLDFSRYVSAEPSPLEVAIAVELADSTEAVDDDSDPRWDVLLVTVRRGLQENLLDMLRPETRQAVELVAFDGLTPDQVAVQIGRAPKDVKLMIRNAVNAIVRRTDPVHRADAERRKAEAAEKKAMPGQVRRGRQAVATAAG